MLASDHEHAEELKYIPQLKKPRNFETYTSPTHLRTGQPMTMHRSLAVVPFMVMSLKDNARWCMSQECAFVKSRPHGHSKFTRRRHERTQHNCRNRQPRDKINQQLSSPFGRPYNMLESQEAHPCFHQTTDTQQNWQTTHNAINPEHLKEPLLHISAMDGHMTCIDKWRSSTSVLGLWQTIRHLRSQKS